MLESRVSAGWFRAKFNCASQLALAIGLGLIALLPACNKSRPISDVVLYSSIDEGYSREVAKLFETRTGQRPELHLHPGGGLVELAEAQDAGGIVRVGAGKEFLRVGNAAAGNRSSVRLQESLHFVMVAHHVKIKQLSIGGEDQAHSEPSAAFIETLPQGANADSAMDVRFTEGRAHLFDQSPDLLALLLAERPKGSQQIGIELNL